MRTTANGTTYGNGYTDPRTTQNVRDEAVARLQAKIDRAISQGGSSSQINYYRDQMDRARSASDFGLRSRSW